MRDCLGSSPWIVDNHFIGTTADPSTVNADGIRALGACHPVIEANQEIRGGNGVNIPSNRAGVHCGNKGNIVSQCVVVDNVLIRGSGDGLPYDVEGVRCAGGSCAHIANNKISGGQGWTSFGVWLETSDSLVEKNLITGGCGRARTA